MERNRTTDFRFGNWLAKARDREGWTQAVLARRLTKLGMSCNASTIAKIEAGDRPVKLGEIVLIADLFNMSVDALLKRGSKPRNDQYVALVSAADCAMEVTSNVGNYLIDISEQLDSLRIAGDLPGGDELISGYQEAFSLLAAANKILTDVGRIARENAGGLFQKEGGDK